MTILGRYKYASGNRIDSCCSVLEQDANKDFLSNVIITFKNFGLLEETEGTAKAAKPKRDIED